MAEKTDQYPNLKLYKTVFNNSPDSILLIKSDGTICYANPAAEILFGYKQEELCAMRREEIIDTLDNNFSLLLNEITDSSQIKEELTFIKKDGTKFQAEVSANIFKNTKDEDTTFMIIRNILGLKENENQITLHSMHLSRFKIGVIRVDENLRINYWNKGAEDIYGYTKTEALDKTTQELLKLDMDAFQYEETQSKPQTTFITNSFDKEGKEVIVDVNSTLISDESGNKGYILVYHDITAQKHDEGNREKFREHEQQLSEELKTSNKELKLITEELQTTNNELILQQDYLLNMNQELEEREKLSLALNRVNTTINSKHNYDEIMESILEEGVKAIGAESSLINLLENDSWVVKHVYNFPSNIQGQVKSHEESPTSVYVAGKREAIAFNDAVNDPRVNRNGMKVHGVASLLAAPIILDNNVIGVIVFYHHKDPVIFSEAQIDFANKLASSLSQAIKNSQLFETIKKNENKYHSLYSAMNEGVALHDIIYNSKHEAVDYVVTDVNNSYEKILGLKREDVIDMRASEIYGDVKAPYIELYSRVARTGISEKFKTFFEPLNKHFRISVISPEKDKFATVFEDISVSIEAEKKLHESEEKYRTIINKLQDGFLRVDVDDKIIMVSPSAARMYNFSSSEAMNGVKGRTLFKDGKELDLIHDNLIKNGEVNDFECTALRNNGTTFYASINCQFHYGDHGQIQGIDAFVRDITERKLIEADLEKSRNSLSEAQRIAHIGSWEWNIETGELVWSDELYNIFKLDKNTYTPTMNSFFEYLHPDDHDFVYEQIHKLLSGTENIKFDYKIVLNNGSTRILTTLTEITDYDENGKPITIMGINQDITEIKKAETEILMNKKVIDSINQVFQESLTAETEADVVMKCLEVAEELTGSEFGFLGEINKNGRLDDRALSPPAWDKCKTENAIELLRDMEIVSYWGRTIKENKSQIVNDPASDPDRRGLPEGHPPIHSFLGVPLKRGEKTIGMIALANKKDGYTLTDRINVETLSVAFVEVLMRKKAEMKIKENMKRLAQSNKELEQFAYITSHDLREPLRMITSFLQLLQRRYSDKLDKDANEFIGFAVDGAKRLDNMTNDLLSYSRITSEKRVIKFVNFENVLKDALQNLKIPIEENDAVITHDPLPTIRGDAKLKVQLFQNIIGNALKYRSQDPPEIHISAKKKKNHYIFSIRDNGIGMSKEHLQKIFTIFQRLHTHDEYEGTGIGLAIAQKIVHQQGGKIWAESELGKGTTFYFTIPIKPTLMEVTPVQ